MTGLCRVMAILAVGIISIPAESVGQGPDSFLAYVASESEDEVTLLRFTPGAGLSLEKTIPIGSWPAEIEGPHGVAIEPGGAHWLVSLGHGFPFGSLLRYQTGTDSLVGSVDLGLFPATVAVSPRGGFAFIANANFHGGRVPGSISVVDLATMTEVERIETCVMPHGSRLSPDKRSQYHTCMMDDLLVEVDAIDLSVKRTLSVGAAGVHGDPLSDESTPCSPTWATPHPDGRRLFVLCNKSSEVVEVDLVGWRVTRSWSAPRAPYNGQVTSDGSRLVVTQKASAAVSVWDLETGRQLGSIGTAHRVTHGVAIVPGDRYAFVTVEGVGGEPGTVEVVDLREFESVARIEVGKQAGGVAFWRVDSGSN